MIQILFKEINVFLNSLIAYIIIAVFLTGVGLLIWVFPESSILDYGFADMSSFFSLHLKGEAMHLSEVKTDSLVVLRFRK